MQFKFASNQIIFLLTLTLLTMMCNQPNGSYSSKLEPDHGLKKLRASVAPILVTLDKELHEELELPQFHSSNPLFGSFDIGNSNDPTVSIVIDSIEGKEIVYIDVNNDNDLTNDGTFYWKGKYEGNGASLKIPELRLTLNYSIIENNHIKEAVSYLTFRRYNPAEVAKISNLRLMADQIVMVMQGSYRKGEISLEGSRYKIAIVDHFGNGLFNDSTDILLIDINQDGKLDGSFGSAENYMMTELFNINSVTYQVVSVSPSGDFIEFKKSDKSVSPKTSLKVNDPAPNFSVTDIYNNDISLDDFRGKILLFDFWAIWCKPCLAEIPQLKEIYKNYHDQGFEILGINYDADVTKVKDFITKNDIPWPQIHDYKHEKKSMSKVIGGTISDLYKVFGVPTYYLIDKDGKILAKNVRGKKLIELLQKSLN